MLGLIQRVTRASVVVEGELIGAIDQGLLLLLAIERGDDSTSLDKLLDKILSYRVFADPHGKMNLSIRDINGGILVVSQFTLAADTQKGTRPGFSRAATPELAKILYEEFVQKLSVRHAKVATGIFAADMQVSLVNDGPVTFLLKAEPSVS